MFSTATATASDTASYTWGTYPWRNSSSCGSDIDRILGCKSPYEIPVTGQKFSQLVDSESAYGAAAISMDGGIYVNPSFNAVNSMTYRLTGSRKYNDAVIEKGNNYDYTGYAIADDGNLYAIKSTNETPDTTETLVPKLSNCGKLSSISLMVVASTTLSYTVLDENGNAWRYACQSQIATNVPNIRKIIGDWAVIDDNQSLWIGKYSNESFIKIADNVVDARGIDASHSIIVLCTDHKLYSLSASGAKTPLDENNTYQSFAIGSYDSIYSTTVNAYALSMDGLRLAHVTNSGIAADITTFSEPVYQAWMPANSIGIPGTVLYQKDDNPTYVAQMASTGDPAASILQTTVFLLSVALFCAAAWLPFIRRQHSPHV